MTPITDPFEVIAAFVDGERVDPLALKTALSRPDGRDYLVSMVALREVVADEVPRDGWIPARRARRWFAAAAAAVALSLAGGYTLGHRSAQPDSTTAVTADRGTAPPPTRVIDVAPGTSHVNQGGQ